jgi:hypothetical protein
VGNMRCGLVSVGVSFFEMVCRFLPSISVPPDTLQIMSKVFMLM